MTRLRQGSLIICVALALFFPAVAQSADAAEAPGYFDPQGKQPSTFTLKLRNGVKAELPFFDKHDFHEAKKGFLAASPYTQSRQMRVMSRGIWSGAGMPEDFRLALAVSTGADFPYADYA